MSVAAGRNAANVCSLDLLKKYPIKRVIVKVIPIAREVVF